MRKPLENGETARGVTHIATDTEGTARSYRCALNIQGT